ncbi:MAG: folate-binding protein YgfZ [Alphaproteobacteria bacterium]|nr:folate-binding protein YgfZ [Alphaproteobacteria bacterium]
MSLALLSDRSVIAVFGSDARPFLQGLISNDIEKLATGVGIYAALLTPQGKILFDFFAAEGDGSVLLDCSRTARDALVKRLSMYRLRAKVQIEPREQLSVIVSLDRQNVPYAIAFDDPRLPALGRRAIGASAEMPSALAGAETYHVRRLELGVPEGEDFGSDKMFALDADLDELHAISFEKGCYVGQELTARMKHRGTARKRLLRLRLERGALPAAGTPVTALGREVGEIISASETAAFALLRLDRLSEAKSATVEASGAVLSILRPDWLFAAPDQEPAEDRG